MSERMNNFFKLLNIQDEDVQRSFSPWRFNVLHVRGVEALTSEDVFEYFQRQPHSIEWLSNISCNATFENMDEAYNILMALGKYLIIHTNEFDFTFDYDQMAKVYGLRTMTSDLLDIPVPPNYRYIMGEKHEKSKAILIRYATVNDKKSSQMLGATVSSLQSSSSSVPTIKKETHLGVHLSSNIPLRRVKRTSPLDRMDVDDVNFNDKFDRFVIRNDSTQEHRRPIPKIRMRMRADEEEERLRLMKTSGGARSRLLVKEPPSGDLRSRLQARSSIHCRLGNRTNDKKVQTIQFKNKRKTMMASESVWKRFNDRSLKDLRLKLNEPVIRVQVTYDEEDIVF